jgi:hypothetical protein
MNNFPLYTTLKTGIPTKDLTILQKNKIVNKIEEMDSEGHELIYALIKTFSNENEVIPCVINNDSITFDLEKMPTKLKQIIYKFILFHEKKIIEDKNISEGI